MKDIELPLLVGDQLTIGVAVLQVLNHAQGEDGEGASQVEHHGGGGLKGEC